MNIRKCAIIGCGAVGATTAFALLKSGLFSELVLLDIDHKRAEGEAMDMSHAASFTKPVKIIAGTYEDLADCAIIVITAGANQSPNETRIDLVEKNTKIMENIIPRLVAVNQEAILLVVSNPVDILTYVVLTLSGYPKERVIGSGTVLDTARLKFMLANYLSIDSRNVHAFVIGEHGDSELPVWSSANISGIDLQDFIDTKQEIDFKDVNDIFEDVKQSAYRIIENKGSTYYAIAMAILRILESIVRNEHSVLPVSCYVDGQYGLTDLCIGLPCIVGKDGIQEILDIPLNEEERRMLDYSADMLKKTIRSIGY